MINVIYENETFFCNNSIVDDYGRQQFNNGKNNRQKKWNEIEDIKRFKIVIFPFFHLYFSFWSMWNLCWLPTSITTNNSIACCCCCSCSYRLIYSKWMKKIIDFFPLFFSTCPPIEFNQRYNIILGQVGSFIHFFCCCYLNILVSVPISHFLSSFFSYSK